MTAIVTSKFRIHNAIDFKNSIDDSDKNYYLFVGKPRPWANDVLPPLPKDDDFDQSRAWESMMGLKKLTVVMPSHVIPRHNWDVSGETIYVAYTDTDENLFYHPTNAEVAAANLAGNYTPGSFYVMTDEFHVFKCLANGGNAKSTQKPLKPGNSLDIVQTADGYSWKYMYTVITADALKWLTDAWIPVKSLTADDGSFQWLVQQGAVDAIINNIKVVTPGSGYDRVRPTAEALTSALASVITLNAAAGSYATVNGFYNGCTIWFETGAAAGTSAVITAYDKALNEATLASPLLTVPAPGDNYKILPTVTITGNGTGAKAKAFVDQVVPDGITSITVTANGSNYRYATATISGGNGSGAVLEVAMPPLGGHGKDAVFELGGHFTMLNVPLEYNEGAGDFPLANDYRQIGLIRNAKNFGTTILSVQPTMIAAQRIVIAPLTGTFQPDEVLTGPVLNGSPQGFIVDYDVGTTTITFIQDTDSGFGSFTGTVGGIVTGSISGATGTVTSYINPEVERYTGDIIYLENRRPITRSSDQLEDLKLIIEF